MKPRRLSRGHWSTATWRQHQSPCLNEAPAVKPGTPGATFARATAVSCLNEAPAVKPGTRTRRDTDQTRVMDASMKPRRLSRGHLQAWASRPKRAGRLNEAPAVKPGTPKEFIPNGDDLYVPQ